MVNSGVNGGAVTFIEEGLKRPLQRIFCLLHATELPVKHLLHFLDGKTNGPKGTCGPIGMALKNFEYVSFKRFQTVPTKVPYLDISVLSGRQDLYLLYYFCKAISLGYVDEKYLLKLLLPESNARWFNTMTNILNLYTRKSRPTKALRILVNFILNAYAPMVFEVYMNPHLAYASKHLMTYYKRAYQILDTREFGHVEKYFFINGYFWNPENVLLSGK